MKHDDAMPAVRLRAMEPEDLDMLYTVENDMEHWDTGTTNVPYSRYVLHDYMANVTGDIYKDRQVRLIIESCSKGEAVGMIDIVNFDPQHRRAELSIIIKKEMRRCGYAIQAVCDVARYAERILHLHQLYVIVASDNIAAISLFLKAGFADSCELKDWLYDGEIYKKARIMHFFCKKHE